MSLEDFMNWKKRTKTIGKTTDMHLTPDYKTVSATGDDRLPYWTSCPHTEEWVIHFLGDHSDTVPWSEFKIHTQWEPEAASIGYRIPNNPKVNPGGLWLHKDWSVSFHKVDPEAIEGHQVYYFVWSAIEHIFCTEAGREALMRHARAEWGGDEDEEDEETWT
jgi:hypothetical protein